VLSLVDCTYFLGTYSLGDRHLVRRCYHDLLRLCTKHFEDGGQGLVVVGNPGIGKSMMGYFLLYQCALKKQQVVVLKSGWLGNAPHFFCQEGVFMLDNIAFVQELTRCDVLCVHI